jgi:HSP20 family protein
MQILYVVILFLAFPQYTIGNSLFQSRRFTTMTFYLHPYPYRQLSRQAAQNRERHLGINIREEDESYVLSALVPGLKAEDLNIQVLDDVLRIEGQYKGSDPANQAEESNYLVRELPTGSFTRTLRLPSSIDADKVDAKIADGILTLTLPKAESARPRRINITAK